MEDKATPIATLLERAEDYGKTNIELVKLKAIAKSADMVSSMLANIIILFIGAMALVILNIGLALWIGKLLGDSFYGFFAVGGFYVLMTVILFVFRKKWIKYPISNTFIKQMLEKK